MRVTELDAAGFPVADFIKMCNSMEVYVMTRIDGVKHCVGVILEANPEPGEFIVGNANISDVHEHRFLRDGKYIIEVIGWNMVGTESVDLELWVSPSAV
jgi:hypothetical protein